MFRASVVTSWILATAERGNHPRLDEDHHLESWSDVTGQDISVIAPYPSVYIIEVVCDAATIDAMNADANCAVMWSEEIVKEETPPSSVKRTTWQRTVELVKRVVEVFKL